MCLKRCNTSQVNLSNGLLYESTKNRKTILHFFIREVMNNVMQRHVIADSHHVWKTRANVEPICQHVSSVWVFHGRTVYVSLSDAEL